MSPKDRRARYELGRMYRRIGDRAAAKEALEGLRTDWKALQLLGEIMLDGDDYAGAIPYLVRSQGRNPSGDYRAQLLIGAVFDLRRVPGAALLRAGQAAEAEKVFREGVRRSPKNGRMLFGLMEALRAQKKTDEAAWVQREFEAAWSKADVKLGVGER